MTLPHHNRAYLCNLFLKVDWIGLRGGSVRLKRPMRPLCGGCDLSEAADLWVSKSVPQRPSNGGRFTARLKPCPSWRVKGRLELNSEAIPGISISKRLRVRESIDFSVVPTGLFHGACQTRTASWSKFSRPYRTRLRDGRLSRFPNQLGIG
jgi:hypothetical protein